MQFSSLKHVFSSLQTQEALLTMLLDSKTSTDSPRYSSDIATRASHAKDSLHSTKQRLEEIKIHAQRCIETFTAALTHLHGLYTDFMKIYQDAERSAQHRLPIQKIIHENASTQWYGGSPSQDLFLNTEAACKAVLQRQSAVFDKISRQLQILEQGITQHRESFQGKQE
uniref:Uncharacterized protein n=1 Tax=Lygus hesperus TaxID=30085 RepID=A0A0A9WWP4_LYGHE